MVHLARERGVSLAVAESLTGGAVTAALVSQPGASRVLLGGIVSYTNEMKIALLGVPARLLADHGSVDSRVALAMAAGARRVTGADVGLATTGVAGPGAHDGKPVGTVYVAVCDDTGERLEGFSFSGDRDQIREQASLAALDLALEHLAG
nr:CinA family protein [Pseudactinotalea sp. HY160]